ncbi:class I SAM-dependent methyltransferase [Aeromicrobium sp. UC242_57]|uniref:class I SAM-dependent methyltransferase n=1 Tax=Aeromicrobium sp. UC242_57 TaxID=3374624 RepID=UPI00378B8616
MTTVRASAVGRLARLVRRSQPPSSSADLKPIGTDGIPGRLLRVVPETAPAEQVDELEGTDAAEVAAVRAGWLLLDAHERLSKRGADRLFGHETAAWHAYAEDTIGELNYTLSTGKELVPETKKNRLRFRRTLDFARHGETVFDVGFGRGLLAAQLIKDRGVRRYHGIDIVDRYVPIATDLFHVNGLEPDSLNLKVADLYQLRREDIEATGAKLVICCEVLEHVPDAELALKTLADALPEGADLLFSVPMHGRIEAEWGHVSVFDVARLKGMLDGAGLIAHHVEPLANTWSLIVASRDPAGSQRVREATGRPPRRVSAPLSEHRDFVYLQAADLAAVGGATIKANNQNAVSCQLTSGGGLSFEVKSLQALRFRFKAKDVTLLTRLVATAYAGDEPVARWTWNLKPGDLPVGASTSVSMRPGEVGMQFVGGRHERAERADRVELVGTVKDGQQAVFAVRVAYLP